MMMKEWRKKIWIFIIAVSLFAAYYISNHWFQLILIQGDSMYPAYHNMQLAVICRSEKEYQIGDVIAFRCDGLNATLVKRIVACGGDRVQIKDGHLYVNGEISPVYPEDTPFEYAGIAASEIVLQGGEVFVIGDNVGESKDSRYEEVGVIDEGEFIGKVIIAL